MMEGVQKQGGNRRVNPVVKVARKRPTITLKRGKDMTDAEVEEKIREKYVILSEEEYNYLREEREQNPRFCCHQSLVAGELISQPESTKFQYKMYSYPFDSKQDETLQRTMVSFLNSDGGYIFIGIKECPDKKRFVAGLNLCEGEKEKIYKDVRRLASEIQPNIVSSRKIDTNFVPVRQCAGGEYIAGRYVIKLTVQQGNPRIFYCLKTPTSFLYYLRYNDQCIKIHASDREQEIKRRETAPDYYLPVHSCLQPELGKTTYYSINPKSEFYQKKNKIITYSVTFEIKSEGEIEKIRQVLRGKTHFNFIFMGPKTINRYLVRLELAKEIEGIQLIIQSYGGKIITIARDEAKKNETSRSRSRSQSVQQIQGWDDESENELEKEKTYSESLSIVSVPALDNKLLQASSIPSQASQLLDCIEQSENQQQNKPSLNSLISSIIGSKKDLQLKPDPPQKLSVQQLSEEPLNRLNLDQILYKVVSDQAITSLDVEY